MKRGWPLTASFLALILLPGAAFAQAQEWGTAAAETTDTAPTGADSAAPDYWSPPVAPARARPSTAPMMGIGTPRGKIEVPPDPQESVTGAVEYQGGSADTDGGGLLSVGDLGEAADDQDPDAPPLPPYQGISPGERDTADPFDRYLGRRQTYLTWIGYEPASDRVFVQLSKPVEYTISKGSKGELMIDLHHTRIATSNNTRHLDLGWFDTVVSTVTAKRLKGGDTRLTIALKEHTTYRLERKGRYIYVYFRG